MFGIVVGSLVAPSDDVHPTTLLEVLRNEGARDRHLQVCIGRIAAVYYFEHTTMFGLSPPKPYVFAVDGI